MSGGFHPFWGHVVRQRHSGDDKDGKGRSVEKLNGKDGQRRVDNEVEEKAEPRRRDREYDDALGAEPFDDPVGVEKDQQLAYGGAR